MTGLHLHLSCLSFEEKRLNILGIVHKADVVSFFAVLQKVVDDKLKVISVWTAAPDDSEDWWAGRVRPT